MRADSPGQPLRFLGQLALCGALGTAPGLAQGPPPLGEEFQVNTYTTDWQAYPSIAMGPAGNFVVVWNSYFQDGGPWSGVVAKRYDAGGRPLGEEFQVNTYTTGAQVWHAVATDGSGSFVVVWTSDEQDGSFSGVFGQRYDAEGEPVGREFQINTDTTNHQERPAVAVEAPGNFVVVWQGQDSSLSGVLGQRYDAAGQRVGGEFQVNTYTSTYQRWPAVAANSSGDFVVSWTSF